MRRPNIDPALEILALSRGPALVAVAPSTDDGGAERQALRHALANVYGSSTAPAARLFLGEVTGKGGLRMVVELTAAEIGVALERLSACVCARPAHGFGRGFWRCMTCLRPIPHTAGRFA
jgi:hypothetical protein